MSATASGRRAAERVSPAEAGHRDDSAPAGAGVLRARVLDALSEVYDPELDEPITTLRFVSSVTIDDDGAVDVLLRLPTPQCAPNFAFLMGADARRVVRRVVGAAPLTVRFEDHYTGDEINLALRDGAGFTSAFPGETDDDELEGLRAIFTRKALIARQASVCERLLADGLTAEQVVALRVCDLPDLPEARRARQLRAGLGISTRPGDPALVSPGGEPVAVDGLRRWLRGAQLVRLSLEANGGICRDLLKARHHLASEPEEGCR